MKQKLMNLLRKISLLIATIILSTWMLNAQTMEKLIIYENFGGADAGSSVTGIQPDMWPDVHADSAKTGGWSASEQNLDGKDGNVWVYQFHANGSADIDSIDFYKTGGIDGLGITVNPASKKWTKSVDLLNDYKLPFFNLSTVDVGCFGAAVLPEFTSWISYASYTPDYLKNQTDEKGYIYLGKNVNDQRPEITIPSDPIQVFENISKIEILFSGSRLGHNNTMAVTLEEQAASGAIIGTEKLTFSATIEPRLVTILNDKQYTRIHIDGWGSANNANVTDFALQNSNTEIDEADGYNYNAVEGLKPDGTATNGQTGNPGISIHMIKIYAKMPGAGYTITTDNDLVTGTTSGISLGAETTLTAESTDGSVNKFMGWNIEGKPDLSEVVNPLTLTVTEDMTVMPVYVGDEVEVAVVDENFTNWAQVGNTLPDENNRLEYSQGTPDVENMMTGAHKVALRHGFTSGGKDSVNMNLVKCNIIPQYGLRVYNTPGWEDALGYIAFMGPNDDKGYVSVDSLDGITKAVVTLSSYDQPSPDRACAILVNDNLVRNKTLRTLYAEDVEITNNPANAMKLQIGPGNQARVEYLDNPNPAADIFTSVSAATVALHKIKLYAKVTVEDKTYYQLTTPDSPNGKISGKVPESGNSTQHYVEGTKVTLTAKADLGFGFDGWFDESDNLISKVNPITITMDGDKTIKPVFAINYTYIQLTDNPKGTVTPGTTPYAVDGETYTFYAGNPLQLTAEPVYGYKFSKWVFNDSDIEENPLKLSSSQMVSDETNIISVVYDSIIDRNSFAIRIDTIEGNVSFNHDPESLTYDGDSLRGEFPAGETITLTAEDGYGYEFEHWKDGGDIPVSDTGKTSVSVVFDKNIIADCQFVELPRNVLIINQGKNGTVEITDTHKDGELEQQGLWPKGYRVILTAMPDDNFELVSVGEEINAIINENEVWVRMDEDTVIVNPEFANVSDFYTMKHNFQDPDLWPMHENNVSNVPGAIDFLELSDDWDPTEYNNDLEALLEILAPYRVWGSESNDHSDGPSGEKDPMTTLYLEFTSDTLVSEMEIKNHKTKAKATVVNYSNCNDCLIAKAVKGGNISKYYVGHVTPGMVALKGLELTNRTVESGPAFRAADSIGIMVVEGFAYVENVEVGYVTDAAQFCPGVFYTIDPYLQIIGSDNTFAASFAELWPLGQDYPASGRPDYDNNPVYGWGAAQEGMIMDKGMTVAEVDATDTRIIITSGYKTAADNYAYSTIYIHDLKIKGSPKETGTGIETFGVDNNKAVKFYMLGNTNMLQVELDEPVKAMVIYDMSGKAIKVLRNIYSDNNQIDVGFLKNGIYGVHCYGRNGEMYSGKFVKMTD